MDGASFCTVGLWRMNPFYYISSLQALKLMVGNNLKDVQLQQVVDKIFQWNEKEWSSSISFEEFCSFVESAKIHAELSFDF